MSASRPLISDDAVVGPRPGTIPVAGPWITEREVEAVADAARQLLVRATPRSRAGRSRPSSPRQSDVAHAIALPSCTSGLHLGLMALGVGPGDEVIVPETTWIATAAPIDYVGATPIFADVEPDTWCASRRVGPCRCSRPARRRSSLVDLYGGFPDLLAFEALAAEHGIALIEDAAEAAGGWHAGRAAGSFGRLSTFSFHGSKTLTTGEGGMVLCDDSELHERMLFLRDHGRLPGDVSFRSVEIGWKYKMSELQAALGRVQLDRIEELIAKKRQIFGWYEERLGGLPIAAQRRAPRRAGHVLDGHRDLRRGDGRDIGPSSATHSPPTGSRPVPSSRRSARSRRSPARRTSRGRVAANPVSYALASRGINLPSALMLTEADVDRVCDVIGSLVDS